MQLIILKPDYTPQMCIPSSFNPATPSSSTLSSQVSLCGLKLMSKGKEASQDLYEWGNEFEDFSAVPRYTNHLRGGCRRPAPPLHTSPEYQKD